MVYTKQIRVARGSTLVHAFRVAPSAAGGEFSGDTATINADTTYNAVYTFEHKTPQPTEQVTLTFNLTVNGQAPTGTALYGEYTSPFDQGIVVFCGSVGSDVQAPCQGYGTVYTKSVKVARGHGRRYRVLRYPERHVGSF